MKRGKRGRGDLHKATAVSANPVAQARKSRAARSPSAPPPTIGKGPHVSKAVRGAGD